MAIALAQSGQTFVLGTAAAHLYVVNDVLLRYLSPQLPPVQASSAVVEAQLDLPPGALVSRASATIGAAAPGTAHIGDVATVRAAAGDPNAAATQLTVDFGALRTVTGVTAPAAISSVAPWNGTGFRRCEDVHGRRDNGHVSRAAGRAADADARQFRVAGRAGGQRAGPDPDAAHHLELLVNGARAAFGRGRPTGDDDAYTEEIDITAAVQAAVDADALPVGVTLRAAVAARLSLQPAFEFLNTFRATFPEGAARAVEAPGEGDYKLAVPLPAEAAEWDIHEVQALVSGRRRPSARCRRSARGSADASLALDAEHAVVVGLPATALAARVADRAATAAAGRRARRRAGRHRAGRCRRRARRSDPGRPARAGHARRGRRCARVDDAAGRQAARSRRGRARVGRVAARARAGRLAARGGRGRAAHRRRCGGGRRAAPTGRCRRFRTSPPRQPRCAWSARRRPTRRSGPSTRASSARPRPSRSRRRRMACWRRCGRRRPVTGTFADGALQLRVTASAPGSYSFSEVRVAYT